MDREALVKLLEELIQCHSPPGEEKEIEAVIRREMEASGAKVWQDEATNLYAHIPGDGHKVMVCAHKDEIGMVVSRIQEDGRLQVENCGGSFPWKYGEGPVEFIADDGSLVHGILSAGSIHTRKGPLHELKQDRAWTWDLASVFTGLSKEELDDNGIHVGSRGVIARERKQVQRLGDYIASYAMDDRMGVAVVLAALKAFGGGEASSNCDLYFVITHGEEIGLVGAMYVAHQLQPDICIAIDTSPVTHETPLELSDAPVIWYREATYNNKSECDRLYQLGRKLGVGAQPVVYSGAASDAGGVKRNGLAARTACFGPARDNSHGYEISHANSMTNVTTLLIEYLKSLP